MTDPADDYSSRAAAFRRLADELDNSKQRSALLAIAEQYEAVGAKLREADREADEEGRALRPW
jgi:hypothetical protein